MKDDPDRLLKGVEAFTYCVALLAASLALFLFLTGNAEVRGAKVAASVLWLVLSAPLHFMAVQAGILAVWYRFGLESKKNSIQGAIAFLLLVPATLTLIASSGLLFDDAKHPLAASATTETR